MQNLRKDHFISWSGIPLHVWNDHLLRKQSSILKFEVHGLCLRPLQMNEQLRFWLYLPGVLCFFILNGGIWLFGLMRQPEYGGEFKTSIIWWLKVCFAMITGLIHLEHHWILLQCGLALVDHSSNKPFLGDGFCTDVFITNMGHDSSRCSIVLDGSKILPRNRSNLVRRNHC